MAAATRSARSRPRASANAVGPLPEIELIATGGVDAANARSFLAAGCVAIAAGGALVNGTPDERRAIVDAAT